MIEGPSGDPDIATPGQVNKVKVHVWNLGLADCWAAHVDLYWCDPSVGINPAVANPIGSTVVPLAAGQHTAVSFDWTPVVVNQGHECLVAQVTIRSAIQSSRHSIPFRTDTSASATSASSNCQPDRR